MKLRILAALCAGFIPVAASALSFDWESVAPGAYAGSVSMTDAGVTATIHADAAPGTGVVYVADSYVPLLGNLSGAAFHDYVHYGNNVASLWDFSAPLSNVTFAYGDSGGDDDGDVTISAYDAGHNLIGTQSKFYGTSASGDTITLNYTGIQYVTATCGGPAPGSVYFEVQSATAGPVPEPASLTALALGGLAVLRRNRNRV